MTTVSDGGVDSDVVDHVLIFVVDTRNVYSW